MVVGDRSFVLPASNLYANFQSQKCFSGVSMRVHAFLSAVVAGERKRSWRRRSTAWFDVAHSGFLLAEKIDRAAWRVADGRRGEGKGLAAVFAQ